MIKLCIFDLDGTVVNSLESIAYSANNAIKSYGFNPLPIQNYKKYAGDGADELIKRCLIASGDKELQFYDSAFKKYKQLFAQGCTYNIKLYDGIYDMLKELKNQNLKIAILSNKPHNRAIDVIYSLFGDNFFDIIVGQSENIKKKPAPDGALYIANFFDVDPKECLYIGDTNTDMLTGNSANMYTVGVTWGFRSRKELEENKAWKIIDKPKQLLEIVNINNSR